MLRRALLVLLALLAICGAIVGAISFSSACVSETGQENTDAYERSKERNSGYELIFTTAECGAATFGEATIGHSNEISAAVTAMATIFIALYTFALSDSTRALRDAAQQQKADMAESLRIAAEAAAAANKSADVAEKNLLIANRPNVLICGLKLFSETANSQPRILFGLRNGGNGFCVIDKISVTVKVTPSGANVLTLANTDRYFVPAGFAIQPGETIGEHYVQPPFLGVNELGMIKNGKMVLEVIFEVKSQDVWRNPYAQAFSFAFDFRRGTFAPASQLRPETQG